MRILFFTTAVFMSLACSSVQVSQDYDQSFDFSALETFAWYPGEFGLADNDLIDRRIRDAIVAKLAARNFTLTDETPDFYVSYDLTVEQRVSTNNVSTGISVGRSTGGRYTSIGFGTGNQVRTFDEGTLSIDVVDPPADRLVWRGIATQPASTHTDPQRSTREINEAVEKMLAQFPPGK